MGLCVLGVRWTDWESLYQGFCGRMQHRVNSVDNICWKGSIFTGSFCIYMNGNICEKVFALSGFDKGII